ncbi:unnamed protein product [Urochloa humidicola]
MQMSSKDAHSSVISTSSWTYEFYFSGARSGPPSVPFQWSPELQGVVQPQASFAGDIRGLHIGRLCSAPSPSSSKCNRQGTPSLWGSTSSTARR